MSGARLRPARPESAQPMTDTDPTTTGRAATSRRDAVPLHRRAGRRDRGPLAGPVGGARAPSRHPTRPARWATRRRSPGGRRSYVLDMFPYPSGIGLHVGHPLGYIATDVYGRFKRMTGHNVLHALGYDAFGLPAEQYAVQTGQHPRITTEANIVDDAPPAAPAGAGARPAAQRRHHRPGLLPLDPVDLPAGLQHLVRRRGGQGPPDRRAGGRAGRRRPAGAARRGGGADRRDRGPSWTPSRGGGSSTRTGWPTCPTRRSTGARVWAPCWPTRRSPPTGAASAATSRSSSATCGSG